MNYTRAPIPLKHNSQFELLIAVLIVLNALMRSKSILNCLRLAIL